ncbi:hypothetical protein FE257_001729 [Aspergillus nanangensis]|uniref:Uncharacterized protein n=1 Tax=Aspergillus nanangensis TaxID=2582783 RepID=A0AAD4CDW3_ASPNN|nr:hypothetical protein FE257_001729 [Aspergillus nanangensis]
MQGEIPAQNIGSLSQVLRAVGGLSKPSGRGLFMFQSLIAGSSTAALLGLFGASLLGYTLSAGAIGFVGGSCVGFIIGTVGYYRTSFRQSIVTLMRYPELLRHQLSTDFGMHGVEKVNRFWGKDMKHVVEVVEGDWALQGMLIAAWHSATPAIQDIQDQEERNLVSSYDQSARVDT